MFQVVICTNAHLPKQLMKSVNRFSIMLLTDRQTDKQTNVQDWKHNFPPFRGGNNLISDCLNSFLLRSLVYNSTLYIRWSSFLLSFFTLSISYLYLFFHDMNTGPPIRPKHHIHWRGWRCVLQARRWHGARIPPAHQIWFPHPDGWQVKRSATCVMHLATVHFRSQMPILLTGINCNPCSDK